MYKLAGWVALAVLLMATVCHGRQKEPTPGTLAEPVNQLKSMIEKMLREEALE